MGKRLGVAGTATARSLRWRSGAISPAWCSSGDKDKQKRFTVEALTTEQNFEGTGLGDQIVFTTQLLKGDTEVGRQGGVCTVTSVARAEGPVHRHLLAPGRADQRPGADRPWRPGAVRGGDHGRLGQVQGRGR